MFKPTKWKDEILDTTLTTESATGTGSKVNFSITAKPLFVAKVTVAGVRVYDWIYNPATNILSFDTAPANGAAILFFYYPEVQAGTNQSAANFNNIEEGGTLDAHMAITLLAIQQYQTAGQLDEEIKTVTLTNNAPYPFNNSAVTVPLSGDKANTNYDVEVLEIVAHTGPVGGIHVTDKLLNGFKLAFDGSGTSVTLKIKIRGGTQ